MSDVVKVKLKIGDNGPNRLSEECPELAAIFGSYGRMHNLSITVGRLSRECVSISLSHKKVMSARYEHFDYDEGPYVALVGDTVRLRFTETMSILSAEPDGVELEFVR